MRETIQTTAVTAATPSGYRHRWRQLDKTVFLWLLLVGVLMLLVINPLARLLLSSVQDGDTGALTLQNYLTAYGRWRYLEALVNSLVLGVAVGALGTVFGVPMAWAVSRTDMPGKGLVWAAILGTFIVPPTSARWPGSCWPGRTPAGSIASIFG